MIQTSRKWSDIVSQGRKVVFTVLLCVKAYAESHTRQLHCLHATLKLAGQWFSDLRILRVWILLNEVWPFLITSCGSSKKCLKAQRSRAENNQS